MKDTDAALKSPPQGGSAMVRVAGIAAAAAALVLAVTLAVRPIASYDVGYHLAYGEHFLDTGQIVQTNRFIYTRLRPDILSDPENLGPGCRYDAATDTYHFINGNWLSQVIMASAHRAGGMTGLGILQAALIAAIFLILVITMRRGGAGWHWIGPAVVLAALAAYERFNIRPEVFGYLILVMQWCLLIKPNFGLKRAVGVIVLQVLAVNLHSYFILGVALVGAMFADVFLRWLWARAVTHADTKDLTGPLKKWLGIATAGVVFACLLNPWFVRGAIMPIQTLLFIAKHNIAGGILEPGTIHPWATIGEFFTPFAEGVRQTRVITAYYVVLCLAGVAGVVGLIRRRWGWLLVLVGMTIISTRMRRNIAPAAMIIVPLALIILTDGWNRIKGYFRRGGSGAPPRWKWAGAVVAIITLVLAGWWMISVMTNRFYFSRWRPTSSNSAMRWVANHFFSERRPWRCGGGVSEITVPLEAAGWINTHRPAGAVFCDYDSSSNLMYFTRPSRRVPLLTNTWAYPPYVMQWVLQCTAGHRPFAPAVAEYDIGTVVLGSSTTTAPLIKTLSKSPDWAVVDVGAGHVVFLRRAGANAALAQSHGITRKDFDVAEHIERVSEADPLPACALHGAATLLYQMRWGNHAITAWRKCIELEPTYYEAINGLGRCLALRGTGKMILMQAYHRDGKIVQANLAREEGLADWTEAERRFKDALKVNPDYDDVHHNLKLLKDQVAAFKRGVIVVPEMR